MKIKPMKPAQLRALHKAAAVVKAQLSDRAKTAAKVPFCFNLKAKDKEASEYRIAA